MFIDHTNDNINNIQTLSARVMVKYSCGDRPIIA